MKRRTSSTVLVALVAGSVATGAIGQQRPTDIDVTLTKEGFLQVKIAIPEPESGSGAAEAAREVVQTIRDDLAFSVFFDVVDPSLYRLVPDQDGTVRHEDWESIGADQTGRLRVDIRAGRLDVEARLYDNKGKTLVFARRYGGSTDHIRRVAHHVSDDFVRHHTGRPGVFMTRIAFVSKYGEGKELYLMDYDGRRLRRLTTTGTINLSPVWSPAGDHLAFVSWRGRQPGIYVMQSDGTLTRAAAMRGELNAAPDWSPDGKQIVYASDIHGNSELYLLELASDRNTRLTWTAAIETAPAFSPNGREIAFTSDRSGTPQVYVMNRDGVGVRRISMSGSYNESPAWSPNGDRLAYVSRIDGRFDIVVLDIATETLSRLTRGSAGEGNNENPRWSPDGRHIVFASNRTGTYDIYTIRADGRDVRRLTRGGDSFTPDWSR